MTYFWVQQPYNIDRYILRYSQPSSTAHLDKLRPVVRFRTRGLSQGKPLPAAAPQTYLRGEPGLWVAVKEFSLSYHNMDIWIMVT